MGVFDMIGSMVGSYINYQSGQSTNEANRQLIKEQNQANIDQWNRENAYNHPINQVQRLRAAGINPGIVYGSGGVTNTSSPSPTMQASKDVAPQVSLQGFGNPLEDALVMAQIDDIRSSARLKDEQATTESFNRQVVHDKLVSEIKSNYSSIDETAARISRYAKENELSDAQIASLQFDQWYKQQSLDLDFQRLSNETKLTNAQVKKLSADTRKALAEAKVSEREFYEMVHTFALRKSDLVNSVNLKAAQIEQAYATARKLSLDADLISFEAAGNAQLASEFKEGDLGAVATFLVGDAINRIGRLIHK